jgi:hypothetical protein
VIQKTAAGKAAGCEYLLFIFFSLVRDTDKNRCLPSFQLSFLIASKAETASKFSSGELVISLALEPRKFIRGSKSPKNIS